MRSKTAFYRLSESLGKSILVCCFFSFLSNSAAAAEDYFDLSMEQLLKARVYSASKKAQTVSETPAAVFVITPEDIARSGATSIPELLRMVPGVNVARSDSNTWAISIRGFQSNTANKILVMIDGRTVYNPLFSATFWEVQDFPLEDILRIEVIRGPGGALWGANAVNGVINILTKSAQETQGNMISAGAGNYERGFVTARHGGTIGEEGFYRVYAKGFNRGNFETFDNETAHDQWRNYQTGFRLDWGDTNRADRVIIHGDAYRTDSDGLDTTFSLNSPFSSTRQETIESRGANILGLWRHTYDDKSGFRLQSYIDYSRRDQLLLQDDRLIFDIEGQYNFRPLGRHEIITGANFRRMSDDLGGSDLISFSPISRTDNVVSVFVQDEITLKPEEWFLTLGTKIEDNHYTGVEVQPNARLSWTPDDQQTVWASVSRAIRTPSRIERDLDITNVVFPPNTLIAGFPVELILNRNQDFDSEELIAYELGYRNQVTPAVSIDTALFFNDYDQLSSGVTSDFTFVPAGVDPAHFVLPLQAVNGMTGEVYGFEMASSWNVRPDWKLSAGYTYLNMVLHAPPLLGSSQESAEDESPQNQFNIRSYWNINDDWTLDALAYYVDELPEDDVDNYVRLDMNLGWKIDENIHFNLVGQNLLDDAHDEFGGTSNANATQSVRSVFAKLTWEF